ncbi:MAG: Spore germination protein GerM [Firmicutes bacterium ADurb.Bin419]|nr:MAG: Spore germination protein GerM [Firmicutes bacterium ADurb.Bin419]
MKSFLCFLLLSGMILFTGCKNPLEEIGDVQSRIKSIKTSNEENTGNEIAAGNMKANDGTGAKEDRLDVIDEKIPNENKTDNGQGLLKDKNDEKAVLGTISITAYYKDEEGTLIPVTRDIPKEEGIAKAAIKSMIDNEENREALKALDLYPVLPQGTEVQGIDIKDGMAIVDFNNNLLNYKTELEEKNIVAGIVYSLSEFKTITKVKILVNGYEKKLKFSGDISGILERGNILINSEKLNLESKTMKLDLYLFKLLNNKHEYLVPVSMEYIGMDKNELPEAIVVSLSKKPNDESLFTQMPENVELVDWSIKDKIVTLDFNKEIKNYGGNAREEGLVKQILYSMKQIDGVERVRILIDGKKDHLPEGTEASEGLIIPAGINKVN